MSMNHYSDEVLSNRVCLEIAKGMVEAKKITDGRIQGKNARDLVNEI